MARLPNDVLYYIAKVCNITTRIHLCNTCKSLYIKFKKDDERNYAAINNLKTNEHNLLDPPTVGNRYPKQKYYLYSRKLDNAIIMVTSSHFFTYRPHVYSKTVTKLIIVPTHIQHIYIKTDIYEVEYMYESHGNIGVLTLKKNNNVVLYAHIGDKRKVKSFGVSDRVTKDVLQFVSSDIHTRNRGFYFALRQQNGKKNLMMGVKEFCSILKI